MRFPLLLVLVLSGCDWIMGPNDRRHRGAVASVQVADTVRAGISFDVTILTGGPDGCWSKDRTEVHTDGLAATIAPYDMERRGGVCTLEPVTIQHTATLTFAQSGQGRIEVLGRGGTQTFQVLVEP